MSEPIIVQKKPYGVEVKEGEKYAWCSCGRSEKQPFCDGSHDGTDFRPNLFVAEKTDELHLCGCKKTAKAPYCDGVHKTL